MAHRPGHSGHAGRYQRVGVSGDLSNANTRENPDPRSFVAPSVGRSNFCARRQEGIQMMKHSAGRKASAVAVAAAAQAKQAADQAKQGSDTSEESHRPVRQELLARHWCYDHVVARTHNLARTNSGAVLFRVRPYTALRSHRRTPCRLVLRVSGAEFQGFPCIDCCPVRLASDLRPTENFRRISEGKSQS